MYKNKYGAIINSSTLSAATDSIKALENQKYTPESYFIVSSKEPSKEEVDQFLALVVPLKKLWKYKILSDESANYLIDEYFVTKSINTVAVLVIDGEITPTLSEDFEIVIEQFYNCWFYKINKHKYFYSVLCNYYTFDKVEEMLIEHGHAEKIYGPITSKEHITS